MLHLVKTFKTKIWDNILIRNIGLHVMEIAVCLLLLGIYLPYIHKDLYPVILGLAILIFLRILINLATELEWFKK